MSRIDPRSIALAAIVAVPVASNGAQSPRPLPPPVAVSAALFGNVGQVVMRSDGSVVVNDMGNRRLTLLDATLSGAVHILESTAGDNAYGANQGTLAAFRGDSMLFFPRPPTGFMVLSPDAKVARILSVPPGASVAPALVIGMAVSSTRGLIYTSQAMPLEVVPSPPGPRPKPGEPELIIEWVDSLALLAVDLTTRRVDTLTKLSSGRLGRRRFGATSGGGEYVSMAFAFIDDFAVTTDGSIAIFRSRDYSLGWIASQGQVVPNRKIPFEWRRFDDSARTRYADSVNRAAKGRYDSMLDYWLADSARGPVRPPPIGMNRGGVVAVTPRPSEPRRLEIDSLPGFLPPTGRNAVHADAENRVWVCRPQPSDQRIVQLDCDVVDRQGALVERVRLPSGRSIVGFAPGFVFLAAADGRTVSIEKVAVGR